MSFEVEVKYRCSAPALLLDQLRSMGAEPGGVVEQVDGYLAHPSRDFAQSNEALRIRREDGSNRLTYKGPKRGGPTKTREEVELPFEDGPEGYARMRRVFEALGFRLVAEVVKTRQSFHLESEAGRLEIAIDQVDGLGSFVEVEAIADGEDDLARAQAAVLEAANRLGLHEVEPRSYLRMHLEGASGRG